MFLGIRFLQHREIRTLSASGAAGLLPATAKRMLILFSHSPTLEAHHERKHT